jgi:hypothetical protein
MYSSNPIITALTICNLEQFADPGGTATEFRMEPRHLKVRCLYKVLHKLYHRSRSVDFTTSHNFTTVQNKLAVRALCSFASMTGKQPCEAARAGDAGRFARCCVHKACSPSSTTRTHKGLHLAASKGHEAVTLAQRRNTPRSRRIRRGQRQRLLLRRRRLRMLQR